jgi:hypothetical protein
MFSIGRIDTAIMALALDEGSGIRDLSGADWLRAAGFSPPGHAESTQ